MQKDKNDNEEEEIVVNTDDTEGEETTATKLASLRKKLQVCEQEKLEYLTGWQRAKADLVNYKREVAEGYKHERANATEDVITDLLSVVESFGMAMKGEAWQNVDKNWRTGVEYIYSQFMNVLKEHGLELYGTIGDVFDPNLHESVSVADAASKEKDHTIHDIIQPGFMLGDKMIRPAKVVVAVYEK